jgi:hypothetical protein
MTGKVKIQTAATSLRLPEEWADWIGKFADSWNVPPAYIYRSAIKDFIQKQSGSQR